MKRAALLGSVLLAAVLPTVAPADAAPPRFVQGAPGIGDPYFPFDGNGGYDVRHYGLDLSYAPDTDVLTGVATIDLVTTQNLSRFNLDLDGMTVHSVTVDGSPATFQRGSGELKITPAHRLRRGHETQVVVTYDGIPRDLPPADEGGGFLASDDGVLTAGQPHVAAVWFPVNDHPQDKAAYTFSVEVPDGLEVVANGHLVTSTSIGGRTTWLWDAPAPMASYLATVDIGEFDVETYHAEGGRQGGIDYVDAVDPDLFVPTAPHTGTQFAISQAANSSYKRLSRSIAVPGGGATLSFWVNRKTEPEWDHVVVEAHTTAMDDWTTLVDTNGHTTASTGDSCPAWLSLHPFLAHYQAASGNTCTASGSSGDWNAASGASDGWEQWSVDLDDFSGSTAEVAISYISDDTFQDQGVLLDDIVVSTGEGTTSFEDDGDVLDGWAVSGPPADSPANTNDWIVGTVDDAPPPLGDNISASLDRQPEILTFLGQRFGGYPFDDSGAIVDDGDLIDFALETQTRPVYPGSFFADALDGDSVVVHELAHQWFGDRVALSGWRHIWLNEGFATYAEWLWSGREGLGTPQQIYQAFLTIPASVDFWHLRIGDPGPSGIFEPAVYYRGAMTLQALRNRVGQAAFTAIVRTWAQRPPSRPTTTAAFRALAENISGQRLGGFFREWLFTAHKPPASVRGHAAPEGTFEVPELSERVVPH
jgi:hypothetical protein